VANRKALGISACSGVADRTCCPCAIMLPQLGSGKGMPRPRKLSAPSRMIAMPKPSRANVMSCGMMLGMT
jgi:hypothetical protein